MHPDDPNDDALSSDADRRRRDQNMMRILANLDGDVGEAMRQGIVDDLEHVAKEIQAWAEAIERGEDASDALPDDDEDHEDHINRQDDDNNDD